MVLSKRVLLALGVCLIAGTSIQGRALMERKMYYLTTTNKIGECSYWSIYLGNYDCTLRKKFPGTDTIPVEASMNLSILSSGYVEGSGYSERGKLESLGTFHVRSGDKEPKVHLDSIQYVTRYGEVVKTVQGKKGGLLINIDGTMIAPKKMELRLYKMEKFYDEDILKNREMIPIAAFAFTKAGIRQAKGDMNEQ